MRMTNKENFNGSSLTPGSSTGGDDYGDRNESGKANVQILCLRSMSRLFYKLIFKLFYSPNPNPKMVTVEMMQPSSLSCASACNHCQFCSYLLHCACV